MRIDAFQPRKNSVDNKTRLPLETSLRPDLVIFSRSTKKVLLCELKEPSEKLIAVSHQYKLDRYDSI